MNTYVVFNDISVSTTCQPTQHRFNGAYRKTSSISRTLVGN